MLLPSPKSRPAPYNPNLNLPIVNAAPGQVPPAPIRGHLRQRPRKQPSPLPLQLADLVRSLRVDRIHPQGQGIHPTSNSTPKSSSMKRASILATVSSLPWARALRRHPLHGQYHGICTPRRKPALWFTMMAKTISSSNQSHWITFGIGKKSWPG